jgi:hypothetical protein
LSLLQRSRRPSAHRQPFVEAISLTLRYDKVLYFVEPTLV